MTSFSTGRVPQPLFILSIIILQSACAIFFIFDVVIDFISYELSNSEKLHLIAESIAAASLIIAIVLEIGVLRSILQRKAHLEAQLTRSQQSLY